MMRAHSPSLSRGSARFCAPLAATLLALAAPGAAGAFTVSLLDEPGVRVTFESEAERVSREAPLEGRIRVEAAGTAALPPDLATRFAGFARVDAFPEEEGRVWRLRLTPSPEGPWWVRPFALTLRDAATGAAQTFATRAADLPAPEALPAADGAPELPPAPTDWAAVWRIIRNTLLWCLAGAALVLAALPLVRRALRALHERTLSPEARARLELQRLVAEGLVERGQFKPFYYALTALVRRYFERAYTLRATRQTSEEFLASLGTRTDLSPEILPHLSDFLAAADRVKYAGIQATPAEASAALTATETLVATDARARQARG